MQRARIGIAALMMLTIGQVEQTFLRDPDYAGPLYAGQWSHVIRPITRVIREAMPPEHDGGWGPLAVIDPRGWWSQTEHYTDEHEVTYREAGRAYDGPLPCVVVTFDADDDGRVDLRDYAEFQNLFGGPG